PKEQSKKLYDDSVDINKAPEGYQNGFSMGDFKRGDTVYTYTRNDMKEPYVLVEATVTSVKQNEGIDIRFKEKFGLSTGAIINRDSVGVKLFKKVQPESNYSVLGQTVTVEETTDTRDKTTPIWVVRLTEKVENWAQINAQMKKWGGRYYGSKVAAAIKNSWVFKSDPSENFTQEEKAPASENTNT
ncbi:TPA: hypothetical protein REU56_002938, partial [Listeria monocytogenes]|nr:hypothetical protein [Listeria monocytogenes]